MGHVEKPFSSLNNGQKDPEFLASKRDEHEARHQRYGDTAYNLGSTNGLPISLLRGNPPGSDGRGPTPARQQEVESGIVEVLEDQVVW